MNTCKTCKWWGEKIPHALESDRRKLHYRPCEWCGEGGRMHSEEQVCVDPDFGCIHYEETREQLPQDHPGYAVQQLELAEGYAPSHAVISIKTGKHMMEYKVRGESILEKSSSPKSAMPEEPTTIMAGLACGHASYVSIYPDKDGNLQCIACANKMRGLA